MTCLAIFCRLNVPPFFQRLSDLLLRQPFLLRPILARVFWLSVLGNEFGRTHIRRLPIQIGDLVFRAQKIFRMPMAFQAPGHAHRLRIGNHRHVIDLPMAARATDAAIHMRSVIVKLVIGQPMNPYPLHRLASFPARAHRLQFWIIFLHLLMTRHAGLGVRHVGLRRDIDKAVAVTAIHSQLGNVNIVGKRDRLDRLVTDLGVFRGDVIPGAGGEAADYHHAADGQLQWQPI